MGFIPPKCPYHAQFEESDQILDVSLPLSGAADELPVFIERLWGKAMFLHGGLRVGGVYELKEKGFVLQKLSLILKKFKILLVKLFSVYSSSGSFPIVLLATCVLSFKFPFEKLEEAHK